MKKNVSIFIIPVIAILFLSCGSTKEKSADEDSGIVTDTEEPVYDDDQTAVDNDSGEPDEDVNDSDNESDNLSFKTRPHGITGWDKTYSYFIRCESEQNLKTVITVSEDDTCKGSLLSFGFSDPNTYSFTPTKKTFPDGRCIIAVECSDGKNKITQKTHIQIPNPFELLGPVEEQIDPKIMWMSSQHALFIKENKLFSINRDLDSVTLLDDDIPDIMIKYSTDQYLYYISKDLKSILKTDGTPENTSKMPIPGERKFKSILHITESGSAIFSTQDDISQDTSLWFYDHKENTASLIDLPDEIENYFSLCDDTGCVFSGIEQPAFLFDTFTKTGEQICSLFSGFNQYDHPVYMNGKIYYRKNHESCITSLEISTCTEEKTGPCGNSYRTQLKHEAGKNYFYAVYTDSEKTEINLFSSEGKSLSAVFNEKIYNFMSHDETHLFVITQKIHETNDPYNCLEILDLEGGSIIIPELMCRPSNVFSQIGFFGDTAFFKNLYGKLDTQFFEVNNDGKYAEKSMKVKIQPLSYTFSLNSFGADGDFYILDTPDSNQIFKTDGTPENTKYIKNTFGKTLSVTDEYIINHQEFIDSYHNDSLCIFDLKTGEQIFTLKTESCSTPEDSMIPSQYYYGAKKYDLKIGNLSFFGILKHPGCGYYSLWSTNGTAEGTINHGFALDKYNGPALNKNVFVDSNNGIYLSFTDILYMDKNGGSAVDLGLHEYSALGVSDDKFIAYKMDSGKIEDIVELKNGKIIKRMMSTDYRYFTNISMSEKRIEMLETVNYNKKTVANFLSFRNCNIEEKPVRIKLFDGFSNAFWNVLQENNISLYSTMHNSYNSRSMAGVIFNNNGSVTLLEPFLYYYDDDSEYDFTAMTIMGDNFVFNRNNSLRSTPFKNGRTNTVKLIETEGFMKYHGKSYSGKAVVEQIGTDYSQKNIIVTDSYPENTATIQLTSKNSDVYLWNKWILENNRYLLTEDRENNLKRIDIISGMENLSTARSFRNLYFFKKKSGLIYRLPETE